MTQHCLEPLEEAEAFPADAMATIFCYVRDLRRHIEDLVAALAPEVETWSDENTRLAQVFFSHVCRRLARTHACRGCSHTYVCMRQRGGGQNSAIRC